MHARDARHTALEPASPPAPRGDAPVPRRRRWTAPPALAAVLLGSLAVKLALWAHYLVGADPALLLRGDSRGYHDSARALLETGTFSIAPTLPLVPQTFRTPGYPSFLAAVYALAGEHPAAALAAQILLSVATVALVYVVARGLWGARVALAAATLLALDVGSLLFSLLLLTETLFTLLLVAALACGTALLTRPDRRRWALGMGIALAACVLVRPVAYYLVAPVALGLAVHGWRARWGMRRTAWTLALLLVPYGAVVGGWKVRNYRVSGDAAFTQVDASVLLLYRGAAIVARRDGIPIDEARARLTAEVGPGPAGPGDAGDGGAWRRAAVGLIRQNPGIYARIVASGMVRTLVVPAGVMLGRDLPPEGARAEARLVGPLGGTRARLAAGSALYSGSFLLDALLIVVATGAAAYCVARLAFERRFTVMDAFLLGVALYLVVVQAGPSSNVRSRVPVEPVLALYAARGIVDLRARLRPAARRAALP